MFRVIFMTSNGNYSGCYLGRKNPHPKSLSLMERDFNGKAVRGLIVPGDLL